MNNLNRGQKIALQDSVYQSSFPVLINLNAPGLSFDVTCFGLDLNDKLSDDRYMIFYNQKTSPERSIELISNTVSTANFSINLQKIPSSIEKLVFTITIDGTQVFKNIQSASVNIANSLSFTLHGSDFLEEKALVFVEFYRKTGTWRLNANGQGFNGGLSALLANFGGKEASSDAAPVTPTLIPVTPAISISKISLDKKIEKEAPHLISLIKKANVSLEKKGLSNHRARCALCLDISASMDGLYRSGKVQELADRVMALATRFDDDGELDVFLFGEHGHHPSPMKIEGCSQYIKKLLLEYSLEGGTRYHTAMKLIREHYFGSSSLRTTPGKAEELPVYIMFITDGGTSNPETSVIQLRSASFEPMFWQFMALGNANFSFLERLDDLSDRFIDNADFFAVPNLSKMSDDDLFSKMMNEYPSWLIHAKQKCLLK